MQIYFSKQDNSLQKKKFLREKRLKTKRWEILFCFDSTDRQSLSFRTELKMTLTWIDRIESSSDSTSQDLHAIAHVYSRSCGQIPDNGSSFLFLFSLLILFSRGQIVISSSTKGESWMEFRITRWLKLKFAHLSSNETIKDY